MTGKDVILAVFHDLVHVDCMGSLYPVTQFCENTTDVNHLVRGFADKQSQRAYCIFFLLKRSLSGIAQQREFLTANSVPKMSVKT